MTLVRFKLRSGTTSQWTAANPVLSNGEPGWDETLSILKIGDGLTPWVDLTAVSSGSVDVDLSTINSTLSAHAASLGTKVDRTMVNAKGDLIVATADDTLTRQALGTNGQVLTVDTTQATGVKWAAAGGSVTYGTTAGTAAEGNDVRIVGAMQKSNNLNDLTSTASALSNLGLAVPSQAEAEAGVATTARLWTAQRVAQAIAALGGTTDKADLIWTGSAWPARPVAADLAVYWSTNDADATIPVDMVNGDVWERHPDAAGV